MALSEFELIRRYFERPQAAGGRADVVLGIGDDAAIVTPPCDRDLVLCMDTLVAGVHFPADTAPAAIGHKALAVNLSDLAAMGAEPAWFTLALTLPEADADWLADFARGMFRLADDYGVQLVGGDVTHGPLSVTVQAHGLLPRGSALRRSGAAAGDRIYVTGTLGDAGLALRQGGQAPAALRQRLDYPSPRMESGQALLGLASAVIDISDGLLADLGHLLEVAGLGAEIRVDALPRSAGFLAAAGPADIDPRYYDIPLTAGDDYELCFTVPPERCPEVEARLAALPGNCTPVGVVEAEPGIRCRLADGGTWDAAGDGYQHFRDGYG
jgi:thiamine-monophosphate kinase